MISQKEYRPVITEESFRRLDIYRAQNRFRNTEEATADLLINVGDE